MTCVGRPSAVISTILARKHCFAVTARLFTQRSSIARSPYKGFGIYNTEYRTVADLTDKRYFFELTTSPNVLWATLGKFQLTPGSPVMILDPDNIALSGDVTAQFRKASKTPF